MVLVCAGVCANKAHSPVASCLVNRKGVSIDYAIMQQLRFVPRPLAKLLRMDKAHFPAIVLPIPLQTDKHSHPELEFTLWGLTLFITTELMKLATPAGTKFLPLDMPFIQVDNPVLNLLVMSMLRPDRRLGFGFVMRLLLFAGVILLLLRFGITRRLL